ncbi:flagellar protein FlaG [mine drainage metagenome]|uniref:Flagellar protein FlaG n=1 Tax=mine drainage metagenome TaxID=410659 RepID=A0A1J5QZZ9_9ZZZZ
MLSQISNAAQGGGFAQSPPVVASGSPQATIPETPPTQASSPVPAKIDTAAVQESAGKINNFMEQVGSTVKFSVDAKTGMRVVSVVDTQTNDVIRQMPSQEMLNIAKALDKLQGLLIKEKA